MNRPITVRMFGLLRPECERLGMPFTVEADVPAEGLSGWDLVDRLGLPAEMIEGMFVNHTMGPLGRVVLPGDRVAFVPYGTPGPHRFCLGLYHAGVENRKEIERRRAESP